MPRNLIAHIYPRKAGGWWRKTVEHVARRADLFDGRKIVGVAFDHTTESEADVRAAFGQMAKSIEFIFRQNTSKQETDTFRLMLPMVINEPGCTTYLHGKGSTHLSPSAASHLWRDAMLEINLDYPDLLECALQRYPIAGAFRSTLKVASSPALWHFAGTFWTFKNDELRRRNWSMLENTFWGVEAYPGTQFHSSECACLFWMDAATSQLYDRGFWETSVTPALNVWRESLKRCGIRRLPS